MRLELRQVTTGYGSTTVLRDVGVVVPSGRIVALLGPNGAGKTTTLDAVSGLLPCWEGRVILDGEDCTGSSPQERTSRGLCHIPETASVYPTLTVGENLRMFARDRGAIDRALGAFPQLRDHLRQRAASLSGGEQRQLALARAYARAPALLMADELSLGLAPMLVHQIMSSLVAIAAGGTSLLLVEQYVSKALEVADIVYVMDRGQVVFAGEPREATHSELAARYLG